MVGQRHPSTEARDINRPKSVPMLNNTDVHPRRREPNRRNRVRIDIYGGMALIDPPVPLLAQHLESTVRRFEQSGPFGHEERLETEAIWGPDHRGRMAMPAGFLSRIALILSEHGYDFELRDHRRFTKRFKIDKSFLRSARGADRRLLRAVRREPLGQIEIRDFNDTIETMRSIIYLYPKAHVLIPVATKSLARKIRSKLNNAALGFEVEMVGRTWPRKPSRCMVCTLARLNSCRQDQFQIVLLPEPKQATGNVGALLGRFFVGFSDKDSHRVYGFVLPGTHLGRRERLRLEAMTGPVIYRLERQHAAVRVLWLQTPDCRKIAKDATAIEFKRTAYWRNDRRNDFVAGVARAFARHDAAKLRKYGVLVDGDATKWQYTQQTKIAVLAASTEQARELGKRLPGWPILDATPANKTDKADKVESVDGDMQAPAGTIITEMRSGKEGLDADMVIRAGGSSGSMCLKRFPPALRAGKNGDVVVVDFTDEFDPRAAEDGRRRRRDYEHMDWAEEVSEGERVSA